MLWSLIVLVLVVWAVLFALHVAGSMIHFLLVLALILFVVNLFTGRRTVT